MCKHIRKNSKYDSSKIHVVQKEMCDGRVYYSTRCNKCNSEIGYRIHDPVTQDFSL